MSALAQQLEVLDPQHDGDAEIPGTITAKALRLNEGLTSEQWLQTGERLRLRYESLPFLIGDWLLYGETHFSKEYAELCARLRAEHSKDTVRGWIYTCRRFPEARRRDNLSFAHHREVAALPTFSQQDELLGLAERRGWGRNQLREEIERRKLRQKRLAKQRANGPATPSEPEIIPPQQPQLVKAGDVDRRPGDDVIEHELGGFEEIPSAPARVERPPYDPTLPPRSFGRPTDEAAARLHSIAKTVSSRALKEDIHTILKERQELIETIAA